MQITVDEIEAHRPDLLLQPDAEFVEEYAELVRWGRVRAGYAKVAMVAICRNAMPFLPQTLGLVEATGSMFREWSAFIYENDSTDGTKDVLEQWADGQQRQCSINDNGRPHLNYTIARERTIALAEYRAACQRWVSHGDTPDYVIVFDTDAWAGWSVDGVATSIAHLSLDDSWFGLASYSWAEVPIGPIHYDAFAARLNHWRQRDQNWFHAWHPPVGSPPVEFNSAFGQLSVYSGTSYLSGTYDGSDCEHVTFHRSIAERAALSDGDYYAGPSRTRFGLNPASRCVSFWVPAEVKDGGQHSGD